MGYVNPDADTFAVLTPAQLEAHKRRHWLLKVFDKLLRYYETENPIFPFGPTYMKHISYPIEFEAQARMNADILHLKEKVIMEEAKARRSFERFRSLHHDFHVTSDAYVNAFLFYSKRGFDLDAADVARNYR